MNSQLFLFLFLLILAAYSCSQDTVMEVNCETAESQVYTGQIETLLNTSCAFTSGCHGAGSSFGDYTTYQEFIDADDMDSFVGRITSSSGDIMPPLYDSEIGPARPISQAEILTLQCWAQNGYLEN